MGKNILITGASRGLGLALAKKCFEEGASLFLVSRNKEALEKEVEIFRKGNEYPFVQCLGEDLSGELSADIIASRYSSTFEKIDGLVNNAAIQGDICDFGSYQWKNFKEVMQVNFFTPARLMYLFLPDLFGGKIVNLSGGGATGCRPNYSAYATSKTALNKLGEILAKENPYVAINSVAPGIMATGMMGEALMAGEEKVADERYYNLCLNTKAELCNAPSNKEAKKIAEETMRDAVDLIVFLLSEESNGITGKIISAKWDDWKDFPEQLGALQETGIYTMRRKVE